MSEEILTAPKLLESEPFEFAYAEWHTSDVMHAATRRTLFQLVKLGLGYHLSDVSDEEFAKAMSQPLLQSSPDGWDYGQFDNPQLISDAHRANWAADNLSKTASKTLNATAKSVGLSDFALFGVRKNPKAKDFGGFVSKVTAIEKRLNTVQALLRTQVGKPFIGSILGPSYFGILASEPLKVDGESLTLQAKNMHYVNLLDEKYTISKISDESLPAQDTISTNDILPMEMFAHSTLWTPTSLKRTIFIGNFDPNISLILPENCLLQDKAYFEGIFSIAKEAVKQVIAGSSESI